MNKENVADEPGSVPRVSAIVSMQSRELMSTVLVGIAVGIIVALVAYLMNKWVFGVVLCRPQSPTECSLAPNYAMIVAMVVGAIGGLVGLARLRIYRPLLIVLAVTIALWGVTAALGGLAWYWLVVAMALLFGFTYGLFAWVSRVRSFILAVVIAVVLVVAIRYVIVA